LPLHDAKIFSNSIWHDGEICEQRRFNPPLPFLGDVLGRGKKRDRNIVDVVERYWDSYQEIAEYLCTHCSSITLP
jgi:hypothetical protein